MMPRTPRVDGAWLCVATLLAFWTTLHATVRSVLSELELRDALLLGVAAIVILPLLPNRSVDPLGTVNPFRLWRLVVAFMSLSAFGYVAQRAFGPRYGLALAGFGSGLSRVPRQSPRWGAVCATTRLCCDPP